MAGYGLDKYAAAHGLEKPRQLMAAYGGGFGVYSIGAIPMAERKLCASVDEKHLLGEIYKILLNDFSMQMSPKTVNYGGKT